MFPASLCLQTTCPRQILEEGGTTNFIQDKDSPHSAQKLIGWKEEERPSRTVDHAKLKKSDSNDSVSRYIHSIAAETTHPTA